jgi:uncharacterized membrane protein
LNRTLLKTGTYALMHLTVAIIVAYVLTRDWRVALAVGVVEPIVQTFAFAMHERLWSQTPATGAAMRVCGHARLWPRRAPSGPSPDAPII